MAETTRVIADSLPRVIIAAEELQALMDDLKEKGFSDSAGTFVCLFLFLGTNC